MSDPSISPVQHGAPPGVFEEPLASESPAPEALMCVDPSLGGPEPARGRGTEALVGRFSRTFDGMNPNGGSEGTSGIGDASPPPTTEGGPSCKAEVIGTVGACGGAIYGGASKSGADLFFAGLSCLKEIIELAECLEQREAAKKP